MARNSRRFAGGDSDPAVLGEGDVSKSSTNLFHIVHNEFPYYTKGGTAWVDVKDVVRIMVALMQSSIEEERFIVSAGNYSYKEIFEHNGTFHEQKKGPPS